MTRTKRKPPAPAKRRILIVDDHPIMREGLSQLIQLEPELEVCGQAETAAQVEGMIKQHQPDLILLDISLPDKNGLEVIKDVHALYPRLAILVLSMHDESLYAERVLRAGGRGYLMKHEGGGKLIAAIRQVLSGQVYVSAKMSARILEIFSGGKSAGAASAVEHLTDRELQVFQLIGRGLGTREIAENLHLSVKTVEVHRANMKHKLGISKSPELIRYAVRWMESQSAGGQA